MVACLDAALNRVQFCTRLPAVAASHPGEQRGTTTGIPAYSRVGCYYNTSGCNIPTATLWVSRGARYAYQGGGVRTMSWKKQQKLLHIQMYLFICFITLKVSVTSPKVTWCSNSSLLLFVVDASLTPSCVGFSKLWRR